MKRWLFIVLSIFMLSGCLQRTELNKLGIVSGIGIDKNENGYMVTAQILNPASIAGKNANALPVYTLTADGKTIYDAYQQLDNVTTQALFLSHLSTIVISEEIAKEGINLILDFAMRHTEIRPDVSVVIAKSEKATDVLNVLTAIDTIPASQLDVYTNMAPPHTGRLTNYNLYDVVGLVNSPGVNVVLNAVTIYHTKEHLKHTEAPPAHHEEESSNKESKKADNAGEEDKREENTKKKGAKEGVGDEGETIDNVLEIEAPAQLRIKELAVFNQDKLVGYFKSEEAQLYNILTGKSKQYVIKTTVDQEYLISFETGKVKTKIKPNLDEKTVKVECKVHGKLTESGYPIDLTNDKNVKLLENYFKSQLEKDFKAFVRKTQTEFKSDILGVGGKAYHQDHKKWATVKGYWDDLYPELKFSFQVEVELESTGEIMNMTR